MKKLLSLVCCLIMLSLFVATPMVAKATDDVYYDLGSSNKLYLHFEVCKVNDCLNVGSSSDWQNYSETSANVSGNAGEVHTIVVAPGDNISFRGYTMVLGTAVINPVYGLYFTNGSYLPLDHVFTSQLNDEDNNGNLFQYNSDNNITLSAGLTGDPSNPAIETGAITGSISSNAPDGTIITGTLYVVSPHRALAYLGAQKVFAAGDDDLYLRSTIRLLVSSPAPTPIATATPIATPPAVVLPKTGADSNTRLAYLLLSVSIIIAFGEVYFLKRGKK